MEAAIEQAASQPKKSAVDLLREEFPDAGLTGIKALTSTDRIELASGIARNRMLPPEQLGFVPVAY